MGVEPLVALPPRVLVAGRLHSAVPLVRVCAAGMASAWSWRTWRRALTTDFPLDMRILGRFLVKLGAEFDYRNVRWLPPCSEA